jgi:hypothetical protein
VHNQAIRKEDKITGDKIEEEINEKRVSKIVSQNVIQNNNDGHSAIKKASFKDSKKNIGSKRKVVGLKSRRRKGGTGGRQTTLDTAEYSKKWSRG